MGGLLDKHLTDKNAEKSGVWVRYTEEVNDDGTYPEFKIKRVTLDNVSYQSQVNKLSRRLNDLAKDPDAQSVDLEKVNRDLGVVFVDNILVDWRNVKHGATVDENGEQVRDIDGNVICEELSYSKEQAKQMFSDSNFADVLAWLMKEASEMSNFLIANRNKDLNS